jgi:aryl-alcohol dehydrogenase-like predicted oxidoreductase
MICAPHPLEGRSLKPRIQQLGLKDYEISSKVCPFKPGFMSTPTTGKGVRHTAEDIREQIEISLKALNVPKLKIWYL